MKKILSMLAAVGLTATAASSSVACTSTAKSKDIKVDESEKTASFTAKIKLAKGTIMVLNSQDPNLLEVIPYKLTNDKRITPFMGIVMKPEKDIKVNDVVNLTELNDAVFFVEKAEVTHLVQKQIGTDNNAYSLTEATKVEVKVIMDLSKAFNDKLDKITWTLVDLNQVENGYQITGIQEKIKFKIDVKEESTPDEKSDDSKESTPKEASDTTKELTPEEVQLASEESEPFINILEPKQEVEVAAVQVETEADSTQTWLVWR